MDVGKLNKKVTITNPGILTADGLGGFTEGMPTTSIVWGGVRPLNMKEKLSFGIEASTASYEITFRYKAAKDLTSKSTLVYSGKNLRVVSVINDKEQKLTVKVIANERAD